MENGITCNYIEQAHYKEAPRQGLFKRILNWLNTHPIEGAEFMSRTK